MDTGTIKTRLKHFTAKLQSEGRSLIMDDDIFHETEVQANQLGALILLATAVSLVLVLILAAAGVFPLQWQTVFPPSIQAIVEVLILLAVCRIMKYDAWWLKYLMMIGLIIVYARLDSMFTHKAAILMVLPVLFSSRYFSRRLTVFTFILTTVVFLFSSIWGATHGMINLNIVTMPAGTEFVATGGFLGDAVLNTDPDAHMLIRNTLVYDYIPKLLMVFIAAIICFNIAWRGRDMVITQHEKDVQTARTAADLAVGARIQENMLPDTFPAFPDRSEFDIYASMDPAREVGGDFYDFFFIDDDHLCIIIADVSGKGIPAALFMMAAMIVLKHHAKSGSSPARILTDANAAICSHNREQMFVTAWLGILEVSTGTLVFANAGHEYPAVRKPGEKFEMLKTKHGFVIGGMENIVYRENEFTMEPGSKLFLYTDGIPESTDENDVMFGTERILEALNADPDAAPEQILKNVSQSVDRFAGGMEQFDDMTMLCLEYKGANAEKGAEK